MKHTDCKRQLWHVNSIIKRLQAKSSPAMTEQLKKDAGALLEIWKDELSRQVAQLDQLALQKLEQQHQSFAPIVAKLSDLALLDDISILGVFNTHHLSYVYIKVPDPSLPSRMARLYYIERGVLCHGGIAYTELLRTPSDTQLHHARLLAKPVAEVYVQNNEPPVPTTAPAARKFMGQRVSTEQSVGRAKRQTK